MYDACFASLRWSMPDAIIIVNVVIGIVIVIVIVILIDGWW